jgi:hypothetical protein
MNTKYNEEGNSKMNLSSRLLPPFLISNEDETPCNIHKSEEGTHYNEYSDEEWLIAKHLMLDSRIEYRNLMKSINSTSVI